MTRPQMRKSMKVLYIRQFPNGTCHFYITEDGVERLLWRHCADGAVDLNMDSAGGVDYWLRVREATVSYAMGVF